LAKKAVKVLMSEDLYEWYFKQSESIGLSVPSIAVLACSQYKEAIENAKSSIDPNELIEKIAQLVKKD